MPRRLSLALGLLLAGFAVWFGLRPRPSPPPSDRPTAHTPHPAWNWRESPTPALLSHDNVDPLIDAWLALQDPAGGPASYTERLASLRALLVRMPAEGFPRLLAVLMRSTAPDDLQLGKIAFDTWVLRDAASATRWGITQGRPLRRLILPALKAWAGLDPLAASTWACALSDETDARWLAPSALIALAAKDPTRALALVRSRDAAFREAVLPVFRQAVFPAVLTRIGQADPAGTVRTFAPELWSGGQGYSNFFDLLGAWAEKDPDATIAWLRDQPGAPKSLTDWLKNLTLGRPDSRSRIADSIARAPSLTCCTEALTGILRDWGTTEPTQVLAWLDTLPDREMRLTLLERISDNSYGGFSAKALPLALALPEGPKRTKNLSSLLGDWAKTDAPAALAWINTHAADPGVAAATSGVQVAILTHIARDEPATAITAWAALTDSKAQTDAIRAIEESWGQTDPGAAIQWAAEQNRARDIISVNPTLSLAWRQKDPAAALAWAEAETLAQRARGRKTDPSPLTAMAGDTRIPAPREDTADFFAQIKDPTLRTETLTAHVREWQTKDPAAAQTWLEKSDALTPDQAAALLAIGK